MGTLRRLLKYLAKYWPRLLVVLICVVASNVLTMITPLFVKKIFDEILLQADYAALVLFSLAIVGATLLGGALNYVQGYINEYVSQRSVYDMRNDLYQSLLNQSFSFYDRSRTGQLMVRATGDMGQIRGFFSRGLRPLIDTILRFPFVFLILVSMDWKLTVLSFLGVPLIILIVTRFSSKIGPLWEAIRTQYGNLTSVIQENLMGVRVVKGFAMEAHEIKKFSKENQVYMEKMVDQARLSAFYMPLADFIAGANIVFILWYGGTEVITGNISFGAWIVFNLYALQLLWPVRFLGFITDFYKRAVAAANRVFEIMDAKSEVVEKEGAVELGDVQGHVRFENVYFGYDKDHMVLKNLNLDVKPGENVAVLGATGSGKSSIINLIPRFYDVTSGKITIDGRDIRDVTLTSLRRNIAIVHQEPFIFSTTIKENIAYGKEGATMEEIVKAAEAAKIHDFISSLPKGYDTEVGERGITLSGGQKQRVAIARALLTNPKIIIFDASTSNVDTETEYEIQRALENLLENRTTFIITQRLSTVRHADKIVVLDEGEIVEEGTHEELMARKGLYYRLYQTQLQEQAGIEAPGGPKRRD